MITFTTDEIGLIKWALNKEVKRIEDILSDNTLAQIWIESYKKRLAVAHSAIEKLDSIE